ncbi:MAG TPA: hypothetical protein VMU66_05795 [Gaiellales bacterium]|nr:hypothetical protein [Gaiellales bacterium]
MRDDRLADQRMRTAARALLVLFAVSAFFTVWTLYEIVPVAGSGGSSFRTLGLSRSIRVIFYVAVWLGLTGIALGGWKALVLATGRPSGRVSAAVWLGLFALFVVGLPVYVAVAVGTPTL